MRFRLTALLLAAALSTGFAVTGAAPALADRAPSPTVAAVTLASTIRLDNCSASLVRYPSSKGADRALMLTNGHCYEGGFPHAGEVLVDRPSSRTGTLLDAAGRASGTVTADRLLYATMTGTDVSLYRLTETYAALAARTGRQALTLSSERAAPGTPISVASGYWTRIWRCTINGYAQTVREGEWTWHQSIRYSRTGCDIIGGSSGSPVVDESTGLVVAVNNTINEDGESCTFDNPCEVRRDGTITAVEGRGYAQETFWFTTCLGAGRVLDLTVRGCLLTKP